MPEPEPEGDSRLTAARRTVLGLAAAAVAALTAGAMLARAWPAPPPTTASLSAPRRATLHCRSGPSFLQVALAPSASLADASSVLAQVHSDPGAGIVLELYEGGFDLPSIAPPPVAMPAPSPDSYLVGGHPSDLRRLAPVLRRQAGVAAVRSYTATSVWLSQVAPSGAFEFVKPVLVRPGWAAACSVSS